MPTGRIKTKKKKGNGDLVGADNKKERAAAFSKTANARVAQAKAQSANGFKGESLNDHGLPDGRKSREIIQNAPEPVTGPKSRPIGNKSKDKYPGGTKGIKVKKPVAASDATRVAKTPPYNFKKAYSESLSKMDDKQLYLEIEKGMNYDSPDYRLTPKAEEAADSVIARKWKRQGGYSKGTKGIKTKKMC